jgi:ankyrin repeat protein
MACRFGHASVSSLLLARNVDLSFVFEEECDTYLHIVARFGHADLISMLLHSTDATALDLDKPRSDGKTALFCAASKMLIILMFFFFI